MKVIHNWIGNTRDIREWELHGFLYLTALYHGVDIFLSPRPYELEVMAAALTQEFQNQYFCLSDGRHKKTLVKLDNAAWMTKLYSFFRNWRLGQYEDPFPNHSEWNVMLTEYVDKDSKASKNLMNVPRIDPTDVLMQVAHDCSIAMYDG